MTLVDPGNWGELSGDRPIPRTAREILDRIPRDFADDGCSSFPDVIGRIPALLTGGYVKPWRLRWACRIHDFDVCTRAHPPGTMTDARLTIANDSLRDFLREYLPFWLRWLGWFMRAGLWISRGSGYFDSCGLAASGASPAQRARGLCRHGLSRPSWML